MHFQNSADQTEDKHLLWRVVIYGTAQVFTLRFDYIFILIYCVCMYIYINIFFQKTV